MTDVEAAERLSKESFCYLTTVGRKTGNEHTIEIWFALAGTTLYMLSGGERRSDWVRNLKKNPDVAVRIADQTLRGNARIVTDAKEDDRSRNLVWAKYQPSYKGDLTNWRERSLPIAVDLLL